MAPELNPWLRGLLRELHQAELAATGSQRRTAFRRTREVIGATLAQGVRAGQLADVLGVTAASIRNRAATNDSTMTTDQITQLTGLSPAAINTMTRHRLQPIDETLGLAYRISDVVQALLTIDR